MSFIKIFKSVLITILSVQLFSSIALAESPKYSVDSSNYMQHADKLTDGQIKSFESYADYRIDVYASSQECKLTDTLRAASGSNATMINGNEGLATILLAQNLSQILLKHSIIFGIIELLLHLTLVFIEL